MAAWGNALGGWRKQKRIAGRFASGVVGSVASKRASKAAAKRQYRSARRANARGHRARVKGSAKARVYELTEVTSKRGRTISGGAALMIAGKKMGSNNIYSRGVKMASSGAELSIGRTRQTAAWSRGLKKSRNRHAKEVYRRQIGSTRKKRALKKAVAVGAVAGAGYVAYKRGNLSGEKMINGASVFAGSKSGKTGLTSYGVVNKGGASYGMVDFSAAGKSRASLSAFNSPTSLGVVVNGKKRLAVNKRGFLV